MGVYIKGMEMPKSCFDCPCINGENGYCQLRKEYVYGEIPRSCPLVPVPPHGDLIDKDATMNAILEERGEDTACWFAGIVNDMPAIVPSDKAEEE